MTVYLATHPPRVVQFRTTRRAKPSGLIVIHTAETTGSAANVARFIANRSNAGSYHAIVDADETIQLCEWSWEAFHVARNNINSHSIGISLAAQAHRWIDYDPAWVTRAVERAARAAADAAAWLKAAHGVAVPARRVTGGQAIARHSGFIGHGELDPARRSDPGPGFPWAMLFARFAALTNQTPIDKETPMTERQTATVRQIQQALTDAGYDLGSTGVDGDPGPKTLAAVKAAIAAQGRGEGDAIIAALEAAGFARRTS